MTIETLNEVIGINIDSEKAQFLTRNVTSKKILLELTGYNSNLLGSIHHGLSETPLYNFSRILDINEMFAFLASSWKARQKNFDEFSNFVISSDVYDIFQKVFKIGMPWLNKYNNLSKEESIKLNPYHGKKLRERIELVYPEAVESIEGLKEALTTKVNKYIFEYQYNEGKRELNYDTSKLKIMTFQPYFPKKAKISLNYAKEISKILKTYNMSYLNKSYFS